MNKKLFLFFLLIPLTLLSSLAQVNVDSITTYYATAEGRINYQEGIQKLNALDSTLTKKDFIALYYAAAVQPSYRLSWVDSVENKIKEYNLLQEFMLANELADSLLRIHPVSITAYFEKSFACYALKRTSEEAINRQKYLIFSKCVLTSGDGMQTSPFKILSYNDAIEVVKYLQLKYKLISVEEDETIVVELAKKYEGVNKIYFKLVNPQP